MKRIKFDTDTIEGIHKFIEDGHTLRETCNRFTIKIDTLRRVLYENGIKSGAKDLTPSDETIERVCELFRNTDISLQDICKDAKIEYFVLQDILNKNFSKDEQKERKSHLYALSKTGEKNPMTGKFREQHPNYKGAVDDGYGYYIRVKPDWYTGRKGSHHVFEHSIVMCENLGITEIPKGFMVHHIDGNPKNNDINNLALLTMSAHSKLHWYQRNLCKMQRLEESRSENTASTDESTSVSSETPDND